MKLRIRLDGSGSELTLHDVDLVVSIHDLTKGLGLSPIISGYVHGSVFRSLEVQGQLYTLAEWEGIAYAAWLNEPIRRGMYADAIPDVGESWTAKKGGTPITWPDWMVASWRADLVSAAQVVTDEWAKTNGES